MSAIKSNFGKCQIAPPTNYPLKKYSCLNVDDKSHR